MTPSNHHLPRLPAALVALALVTFALVAGAVPAAAQVVTVTLPAAVSFNVLDVTASTAGSPDPTGLQFTSISLQLGSVLRVSVQAEAPAFTPPAPGRPPIPASSVSWTTSGAQGGSGTSGTLSEAAYGQVFQGNPLALTAAVDVHWTLAPVGSVRAGWHDLTLRWKIESVTP